MKKLKLWVVTLMIGLSFTSFSQISVKEKQPKVLIGEINPLGAYYASLTMYYNHDSSTYYRLHFRDISFKYILEIESIRFDTLKDVEDFYHILINEWGVKRELEVSINNEHIVLKFNKNSVEFLKWSGSNWRYSTFFNKKQINKLFGKND